MSFVFINYLVYTVYIYIYIYHDDFVINLASPRLAPSNFRIIDVTPTSVTFQWDALSNQQANGVVQQYVITCTERNTDTEVCNQNTVTDKSYIGENFCIFADFL